jgi:hypothetical protein
MYVLPNGAVILRIQKVGISGSLGTKIILWFELSEK